MAHHDFANDAVDENPDVYGDYCTNIEFARIGEGAPYRGSYDPCGSRSGIAFTTAELVLMATRTPIT